MTLLAMYDTNILINMMKPVSEKKFFLDTPTIELDANINSKCIVKFAKELDHSPCISIFTYYELIKGSGNRFMEIKEIIDKHGIDIITNSAFPISVSSIYQNIENDVLKHISDIIKMSYDFYNYVDPEFPLRKFGQNSQINSRKENVIKILDLSMEFREVNKIEGRYHYLYDYLLSLAIGVGLDGNDFDKKDKYPFHKKIENKILDALVAVFIDDADIIITRDKWLHDCIESISLQRTGKRRSFDLNTALNHPEMVNQINTVKNSIKITTL